MRWLTRKRIGEETVLMKVTRYVNDKMNGTRQHFRMSSGDIVSEVVEQGYHNKVGSIIPSDYCYNRFNLGLFRKNNIKLFVWHKDEGLYEFVGEDFSYCGDIYGNSKYVSGDVIGQCRNGIRELDKDYLEYAQRQGRNVTETNWR